MPEKIRSRCVREMKPFSFRDPEVPAWYRCDQCSVHGVRLYRDYNTFASNIDVLCATCAEVHQKKPRGFVEQPDPHTGRVHDDQIGWMIAAVPTEGDSTFWGRGAVPTAGCAWWFSMPIRPPAVPLTSTQLLQARVDWLLTDNAKWIEDWWSANDRLFAERAVCTCDNYRTKSANVNRRIEEAAARRVDNPK